MRIRRTLRQTAAALALLIAAACGQSPQEARPALWQVKDEQGRTGWLFGTIHSAQRPLAWQTPRVTAALEQSGAIYVEVANLADGNAVASVFARLAKAQGQPPLSARVDPADRPALAALLADRGYKDGDFAAMDTWAAALTLAREDQNDGANGVDRAVIASAKGRRIVELEGAAAQLGLFDTLPEAEQRDLLAAVAREAAAAETDISESWRNGDMRAIEAETRDGLLADPELREVLFTGRNRTWAKRIGRGIRSGETPFVAVGAAHMAGPQGLPAMLAAQGFTVTRTQ